MSDAISTDVGAKDAHDWFGFPEIPGNEGLIPSSSVDHILIFRVFIELAAVDSVGMAVMRGIRFFQLNDFFPFDLIINPNNRLTSSSN